MKWLMSVFSTLMIALLLSGCVSFDYVGQVFDPIPERLPIEYYTDRAAVPGDEYQMIGKGTLTIRRGEMTAYDVQEYLEGKAREYGADAVCMLGIQTVQVGIYEIHSNGFIPLEGVPTPSGAMIAGQQSAFNSFEQPAPLQGEFTTREDYVIHALFYRDKKSLKQQLELRAQELDDLLGNPAKKTPAVSASPSESDKKVTPETTVKTTPEEKITETPSSGKQGKMTELEKLTE